MGDFENFGGDTSEFNMGSATMARLDAILKQIIQNKTIMYSNGVPLHLVTLRLYLALFDELYPWLTNKEKKRGLTYLHLFKENPIVSTGSSLLIPQITDNAMDTFFRWQMVKLKKHNLLSRVGENPEEAME